MRPLILIRHRSRVAGALLAGLLLAALGWLHALTPTPPPDTLRVALGPWLGYDPWILARESGLLDASVRLAEMTSATESLEALRDGQVEAAGLTLDEALRARSEGIDLKVVALLSDSRGADALVAREAFADLAALRGRKVLVEDSALGAYLLERVLASAGLRSADVLPVRVRASTIEAHWDDPDVAAAVTYEPILSRLRERGARELFSTREHHGLVYDVLAVRSDALASHRAPLQALLHGWELGCRRYAEPQHLPLPMLALGMGLSAEQYRQALAGVQLFCLHDSLAQLQDDRAGVPASARFLLEWLRREGAMAPLAGDWLDTAPLQAALQAERSP